METTGALSKARGKGVGVVCEMCTYLIILGEWVCMQFTVQFRKQLTEKNRFLR